MPAGPQSVDAAVSVYDLSNRCLLSVCLKDKLTFYIKDVQKSEQCRLFFCFVILKYVLIAAVYFLTILHENAPTV